MRRLLSDWLTSSAAYSVISDQLRLGQIAYRGQKFGQKFLPEQRTRAGWSARYVFVVSVGVVAEEVRIALIEIPQRRCAARRPLLRRPDYRHRQPQLLQLRQHQQRRNLHRHQRRPRARRSVRRQHRQRLAPTTPTPPNLFGIDYLRALLADQRREEHFWRLGR
jgi:hypothetical protein